MYRLNSTILKYRLCVKSPLSVPPAPQLRLSRGTREVFINGVIVDIDTGQLRYQVVNTVSKTRTSSRSVVLRISCVWVGGGRMQEGSEAAAGVSGFLIRVEMKGVLTCMHA